MKYVIYKNGAKLKIHPMETYDNFIEYKIERSFVGVKPSNIRSFYPLRTKDDFIKKVYKNISGWYGTYNSLNEALYYRTLWKLMYLNSLIEENLLNDYRKKMFEKEKDKTVKYFKKIKLIAPELFL